MKDGMSSDMNNNKNPIEIPENRYKETIYGHYDYRIFFRYELSSFSNYLISEENEHIIILIKKCNINNDSDFEDDGFVRYYKSLPSLESAVKNAWELHINECISVRDEALESIKKVKDLK